MCACRRGTSLIRPEGFSQADFDAAVAEVRRWANACSHKDCRRLERSRAYDDLVPPNPFSLSGNDANDTIAVRQKAFDFGIGADC
jgi:hypothetical protein